MAHWEGMQQHYRKSPILNAVLQHEQGRTLLLRRYRDMLIAEKTRLEQHVEVLTGEITKQHRAIVGCKKSLKLQQAQFQAKRDEYHEETVSYRESQTQQRECFEAVLEKYREELRQKVEYMDKLSMQLTREDSALDACRRDQTDAEGFIQSVKDLMKQSLGIEDTDEIHTVRVFDEDSGILAIYEVLYNAMKLHKVQREKST
jgi:hypothetical protein